MPHNSDEPHPHQQEQDDGEARRHGHVGLLRPHEMHHAGQGGEINQAVERRPPATEAADRRLRGRQRKRDQQQEAGEADGDVRPLRDVLRDLRDGAGFPRLAIEQQVDHEVDADVCERPQADRPPVVDQLAQSGHAPQRRDRERRGDEEQAPPARAQLDPVDPVTVNAPGEQVERDQDERDEAREMNERLEEPLQKFLLKSIPVYNDATWSP